jgi:hypothetical protein
MQPNKENWHLFALYWSMLLVVEAAMSPWQTTWKLPIFKVGFMTE